MQRMIYLVVVMTLLIFVGFGLLVYGLVAKGGNSKIGELPALTLPAKSHVEHMAGTAGGGIALYITGPEGDKILFVDPKNGLRGALPVQHAH